MKKVIMLISSFLLVMVLGMTTLADDAQKTLYKTALNATKEKQYEKEDGGYIAGPDVWKAWDETSDQELMINEDNYQSLSSSAKKQFTSDFTTAINTQLVEYEKQATENDGYTDTMFNSGTVSSWYKSLQLNSTIGTQLMRDILAGAKPEFEDTERIYKPYDGVKLTVLTALPWVGIVTVIIFLIWYFVKHRK